MSQAEPAEGWRGWSITVDTGRGDRPVDGGDTTMFAMPEDAYVDLGDGKPTLRLQAFSRMIREVAEDQATALGRELHHADFWISTDPEFVREKGTWHDCQVCRDGMVRAMDMMAANPRIEMVVGRLYWTA